MNYQWQSKANVFDIARNYGPGRGGGIGVTLGERCKGYVGFGNPYLDPDPTKRKNPRGTMDPTTASAGIYYLADILEYDPVADTWTALWIGSNDGKGVGDFEGTDGPPGRQYPYAFGIGKHVYVGSGFSWTDVGWMNDLWRFDTISRQWEQMPDPPETFSRRHKAIGFSMKNGGHIKGYMGLGGVQNPDGSTTFLNDFWEFDPLAPINNQWTRLIDYPLAISEAVAFSLNAKGYIGTGMDAGSVAQKRVDSYEGATWASHDLSAAVTAGVAFACKGRGYIGMGSGALTNILYEFDGIAWNIFTILNSIPVRGAGIGLGLAEHIYIGTGYANPGHLNDFWELVPETVTHGGTGDGGSNPKTDCAALLANINSHQHALDRDIARWIKDGRIGPDPANSGSAANIIRWRQEYIDSGCRFPR